MTETLTDTTPTICWQKGTAYDLFVSLHAVFNPGKFEIRRAWAAGVRSRLNPDEREVIEQVAEVTMGPLWWVKGLPEPRGSSAVIDGLAALAPIERVRAMTLPPHCKPELLAQVYEVSERGEFDDADVEAVQTLVKDRRRKTKLTSDTARKLLALWAEADYTGEAYLAALRSYVDAFFAEEEKRIEPALSEGLKRAQALAETMPLQPLLEELSQGLRFEALLESKTLVLAPSYWSTPLVVFERLNDDEMLLLFGARPANASLVPGEVVPDALFNALKALADPTRLRIMRYLTQEPLTPAQLSRRLRLRAPTVTHHLHALRIAGLVHLTLKAGNDRRYAARQEMIDATCHALGDFLTDRDETDS